MLALVVDPDSQDPLLFVGRVPPPGPAAGIPAVRGIFLQSCPPTLLIGEAAAAQPPGPGNVQANDPVLGEEATGVPPALLSNPQGSSPSVPPVPETGQPPVRPTNLLSAWKVLFHPRGHRVFGSGPMSDQQPRINGRLLPDVGEHGGRAHLAQFSDPFAAQPRGVHHHPFLVPALTHGKYPSRSRGN